MPDSLTILILIGGMAAPRPAGGVRPSASASGKAARADDRTRAVAARVLRFTWTLLLRVRKTRPPPRGGAVRRVAATLGLPPSASRYRKRRFLSSA